MYLERRDDTSNIMAKKAMSRNTFDEVMRFTHFANADHQKDDLLETISSFQLSK